MRKNNRRSSAKKERIIMMASAGFVLAALTMTGIYMKSQDAEVEDDGYTLDLAELENSHADQLQEIADNSDLQETEPLDVANADDAMDYMPIEVGSGLVEIPGLTDGVLGAADADIDEKTITENADKVAQKGDTQSGTTDGEGTAVAANTEGTGAGTPATEEAVTENIEAVPTLHFVESDGLLRPVSGEVLLPFSMDGSIYFSTLNHYKYNPALMISAEEGTTVAACTEGIVISVFDDAQIGTALVMELGDGYQITYGQLKDITVSVGEYVSEGQAFAAVAAPTKYFSVEGSNLYLKVTADGAPVNPEVLFR